LICKQWEDQEGHKAVSLPRDVPPQQLPFAPCKYNGSQIVEPLKDRDFMGFKMTDSIDHSANNKIEKMLKHIPPKSMKSIACVGERIIKTKQKENPRMSHSKVLRKT